MMKSRFFLKKDEVVVSTLTMFIVVALFYQGLASSGKEHAMFQKDQVSVSRK